MEHEKEPEIPKCFVGTKTPSRAWAMENLIKTLVTRGDITLAEGCIPLVESSFLDLKYEKVLIPFKISDPPVWSYKSRRYR